MGTKEMCRYQVKVQELVGALLTCVLLPTSPETATQLRPCWSTAFLSLRSSTLLHESWTCLPPGSGMRPAATSTSTLCLHCCLVLLPTLLATAAQSLPCRATARLSAPSSTLAGHFGRPQLVSLVEHLDVHVAKVDVVDV